MTEKRGIGVVAAGSLTAAIVLLAGLAAAKADELSDLRANQQPLQQRIDQLPPDQAQAPPPSLQVPGSGRPNANGAPRGGTAAPDQPLLGGSFPRSFVIPGTSTSVRVGGSIDESFGYRTNR